jgi:nucleoside-diphosphate-sugar epimerase
LTKSILVTGATGFVGRQVTSVLLSKNVNIVKIVRQGDLTEKQQESSSVRSIYSQDLFNEDVNWWENVLRGIDVIIHCAWYAEPGKYLTSDLNLDCLAGSLVMTKAAVKVGVKKIVGIGSCFEYDFSYGILAIDTPLKPRNIYASSKIALYQSLLYVSKIHKVDFAWCRLFYIYGEGEDERRLHAMVRSYLEKGHEVPLTSGLQVRDYMDVSVAAEVIANIALSPDKNGAYNICSGVPITVREIAEGIAKKYGMVDKLKFGAREPNTTDPLVILGIPNF